MSVGLSSQLVRNFLLGFCLFCLAPLQAQSVALFNGKNLEGWEGNPEVWRVKDGTIQGGSMEGNSINEFLATKKTYRNFKLKLEYKLVGTEGFVNGGVQIRSQRIQNPPNEMIGYQADIGAGYTGCLYDESRRKIVLAKADENKVKSLEKIGEWNQYEVHALGDRVVVRLNGSETISYTEKDQSLEQSGLIALQIHGDCKAVIAFRNLQIEELSDDNFPTESQALNRLKGSEIGKFVESKNGLPLEIAASEVIAFVGQANWVSAQKSGELEALLGQIWKDKAPVFRWMAWEGDTVYEQWRDFNFGSWDSQLKTIGVHTLLVQFGQMEALEGEAKLLQFKTAYHRLLDELQAKGRRVVLVSPTPYEKSKSSHGRDLRPFNKTLELYVKAIQELAKERGLSFVDLFHSPELQGKEGDVSLTDNGVHWNSRGLYVVAQVLKQKLAGKVEVAAPKPELVDAIREKNRLWFDCWRPANWSFVYGDRVAQMFGKAGGDQPSLRQTFENHREWIRSLDQKIQALQEGKTPEKAEEKAVAKIETSPQLSIEEQKKTFTLAPGYEIELFAGEELGVIKPTQIAWDEKGRLYVACSPTYPHMQLGGKPGDYILVLEDRDGDGKADKSWKFAEGLTMVQGLEVGKGGLYVCDFDQIAHYVDRDGDGKAEHKEVLMSGFGVGDTHQLANSICYGPDGSLWFSQGLHAFSRVETPWGVARLDKAGLWRYRPRTEKLESFFNGGKAGHNCWGVAFDDRFQVFHKSGDRPDGYYSVPGLISLSEPDEYHGIGSLFKTFPKTTGLEFIGTQGLPKEIQGHVLIAGYFGSVIEIHKLIDDGAGFRSEQLPKLLTSSNQSFRPVDLSVGPDGAIYVADWFNPVIGHYQASYADPRRDRNHGRIWRIRHKDAKSVEKVDLASKNPEALLKALSSEERWVRYQAKRLLFDTPLDQVEKAYTKLKSEETYGKNEAWLAEVSGVFASHEVLPKDLVNTLAASKDAGWRAYATRLVGDFPSQFDQALKRLDQAVEDEAPRVRLEAVVALAKLPKVESVEVASKLLNRPMDRFLEYALHQNIRALKPVYEVELGAGKLTFDGQSNRLNYVKAKVNEGPIRRHPGQKIYEALCLNCHQPDGKGLGDIYPPVAESERVSGDPSALIKILMHGMEGPITVKGKSYGVANPLPMPPSGLNDQEIADVLSYVRSSFGNNASSVATQEVREIRQKHQDRVKPWHHSELK